MQTKDETRQTLQSLAHGLRTLAVLRDTLQVPVVCAFARLLDMMEEKPSALASAFGAFVAELYNEGGDLGAYLVQCVQNSKNPVVKYRAGNKPVPAVLQKTLEAELDLFGAISALCPQAVAVALGLGEVPGWNNTPCDFKAMYMRCLEDAATRGYGVFAQHHMFTLGPQDVLQPVKNPDPQRLEQLTGYVREREQVLVNTRALLRGLPAANILLYGDAGTGKSSTVKAIANAYAKDGLRLVEVRKTQLYQIPRLMDSLADNPLKFILFIDDLSFSACDGDFTELKAILEGNVSARPGNIVVYATSNRRHMVQESHADRRGDDIHRADTLEEQTSLAARFGLTITFLKPDKDLYLDIVHRLAAQLGLQTPQHVLGELAEVHALRHGGRSPRTARQFVELQRALEDEKTSAF